ncbi:MAG: hypothetical protein ACK5XN_24245, partial [Bacteroidota bacterium]
DNTSTTLSVCDTSFYDSGGPLSLTGSSFKRTFLPATPGSKLRLTINSLDLFSQNFSSASLNIYDGLNTSAPAIATLRGRDNGNTLKEFIASNPDGALTVEFVKSTFSSSGWWGGLTCYQPEVYRTISNGNWNNPLIWEKKNISGTYVSTNNVPQKGDDSIYIRHNVLINNSYLIDQVVIEENGNLRIESPDANFISINTYKVLPQPEFLVRGTLTLNDKVQIFGNNGYMEVKGNLINAGKIDLDSVLFTGNQPQILGSPGFTGALRNIRISNPAGITLAGNQQVAGILFDKGLINTDNIAMIILSEGESSRGAGTTSHINGPAAIGLFGSGNRIYPIGKNGTYLPVELNC